MTIKVKPNPAGQSPAMSVSQKAAPILRNRRASQKIGNTRSELKTALIIKIAR
ncbi:MAG: hypothetical protein UY05_C0037G0005 [Candidatus Peregrinibacteria bacterium GW2011_GWA2_47_7]|nr:MAG: hypothetical protein UY05_C0037G0005 [Candidatus Peregrinibacteria bacterium GW2011_GWA2_47_7]